MFGPYEAERINDAFNNSSQEKGDRNSAFKTEFERQYYINGLSSQKVDEAIFWLEKSENAGITGRDTMLTKLKTMKGDLGKMQTQVRSETSQVMFDMNNPIKIDRTNFGDLITTRKYNGHNMPNGGGYFQENPTVKGISVIWGENKTVIHSIVIHGKQYIREPDGWFKSSTDQKILVELEGDNIYINRKVAAPQNADPVMAKPLESGGDLNDFQDKMKSVKFTINGKDGTVNKIDKVGNELMVQLDNASITVYFEKKDGGYIVAPKSTANYTVIDTPPSSGNTRTIALTAKDSAVLSKVSTQGDNRNDGDRGGSATKPPAKETVKHVRSANEITGANSTYIAKNRGAIDEAVNKTTDPGKKTTIIGYINHPTKENIIKLQDEIGAGKDGDFRGKTLSSLKTWAGIDVPPATPAGPNIPAESAPVLTGISPELLNPGADKSTLDTALKAAGYTIVGQVDNPLDDGEVENIYKKIDGTKRTLVHVVSKGGKIVATHIDIRNKAPASAPLPGAPASAPVSGAPASAPVSGAAAPGNIETTVSVMPPVTIVGLTGDQYKDLKPEYDKDRKAIFIKLEHTGGKYVGIQETKFNAGEGVEYPATIDGKKYKITLTPSADKKSLTVKADEIKESPLDAALSAIGYKKTGTDKYENGQLVLSISNSSTTLDKTGGSVNPDELNTVRKVLEAQKKTGKIFYNNGSASVRIQPV